MSGGTGTIRGSVGPGGGAPRRGTGLDFAARPAGGAPHAGDVVRLPHPAGLLWDRVSGHGPVHRRPLASHRRPRLQGAGEALVEGDDDPLCGRGGHGTILSFEFGLLWPNFTATFGEVFGLGFAIEGFSFFIEAIFIAIYVYGWDRLRIAQHFLCGIPIVIAGLIGSLFVISVNAWMNHPAGFDLVNGKVINADPWAALFNDHLCFELTHMYFAGYMVAGFLVAAVYAAAWLSGGRSRYNRAALIIPLTFAALVTPAQLIVGDWAVDGRRGPARQAGRLRGSGRDDRRCLAPHRRHLPGRRGQVRDRDPRPALDPRRSRSRRQGPGPGHRAARDRPPINVTRLSFQTMVFIGTGLAALAAFSSPGGTTAAAALELVLPSTARCRPPRPGGTDRRLGHRRGRPAALGRLRGDAHRAGGDRRGRAAGRLLALARSTSRSVSAWSGCCAAWRAARPRWRSKPRWRPPMLPEVCLGLVIAGITAYAVLGGADFGAGFWDLTAGGAKRGGRVRGMVRGR